MNLPEDRRYAPTHEWVRPNGDVLEVGITDLAQEQLGDLMFVGDVKAGVVLRAGEPAGVVESVKAASDIHAPVAGEITEFNTVLSSEPERINEAAFDTWIFRIRPANPDDWMALLDAAGYRAAADT